MIATGRVLRRFPGVAVCVSTDQTTETFRTPFLFVANNEYRWRASALAAASGWTRGKLYHMSRRVSAREMPKLAVAAVLGRATRNPSLRAFATSELEVEHPGRRMLRVALDGEVIYIPTPLRYRVRQTPCDPGRMAPVEAGPAAPSTSAST